MTEQKPLPNKTPTAQIFVTKDLPSILEHIDASASTTTQDTEAELQAKITPLNIVEDQTLFDVMAAKEKTMSQNDAPSKSDDELRDRIYRLVDEKLIRCMRMIPDDDPIQAQITDSVMELFRVELEGRKHEKPVVNRFEVINHLSDGTGREVVVWKGEPFEVETSSQDDGRTVKVFLTDVAQLHKESQEDKKS